MAKFMVDNTMVEADEGITLLRACLENDIYIPNLCWIRGMADTPVSCRLCFVEIEGEPHPVASCKIKVRDDMVVTTDTPAVRRLQKTAFQLLMSAHEINCKVCPANKKCELQKIARFLKTGLKPKRLEPHLKEAPADMPPHPSLDLHVNRCVLCGRCIYTCIQKQGQSQITFAKRGIDTIISFYGAPEALAATCSECVACVAICPVSAITLKRDK
jgi:NADH dehydrogenase/NADH:ubiquinone oxidoreductase subunit G